MWMLHSNDQYLQLLGVSPQGGCPRHCGPPPLRVTHGGLPRLFIRTREGTDLHSQCVSPYQEVQMEGRVQADLEIQWHHHGPRVPSLCMLRMSALCAGSFPTSYEMAAAVPAITSRHGYVLNSLGVGKPFSQAAQCPAPFLWWLELPTFRVITDKLEFTLALERGSPSPQSCLGKRWRRPVTAKLSWSSASKEEERVGIEQAASSVCRRQSLLSFTSFLTLGKGCDFLHLVPALCSVSLCLALVTWYCYSNVIFHGICWLYTEDISYQSPLFNFLVSVYLCKFPCSLSGITLDVN